MPRQPQQGRFRAVEATTGQGQVLTGRRALRFRAIRMRFDKALDVIGVTAREVRGTRVKRLQIGMGGKLIMRAGAAANH